MSSVEGGDDGVQGRDSTAATLAEDGHHEMVGQPHTDREGPVAEAEARAAELSSTEQPLGTPGPRFNPRAPFFVGLAASAGVAVTYGAVHLLMTVSSVLVLIGLAFEQCRQGAGPQVVMALGTVSDHRARRGCRPDPSMARDGRRGVPAHEKRVSAAAHNAVDNTP